MLVAKCYTVLDAVMLEVSCVHIGNPDESHLVIRETRTGMQPGGKAQLRALGDACDLASHLPDLCDAD